MTHYFFFLGKGQPGYYRRQPTSDPRLKISTYTSEVPVHMLETQKLLKMNIPSRRCGFFLISTYHCLWELSVSFMQRQASKELNQLILNNLVAHQLEKESEGFLQLLEKGGDSVGLKSERLDTPV